jgi:hypothetical protein
MPEVPAPDVVTAAAAAPGAAARDGFPDVTDVTSGAPMPPRCAPRRTPFWTPAVAGALTCLRACSGDIGRAELAIELRGGTPRSRADTQGGPGPSIGSGRPDALATLTRAPSADDAEFFEWALDFLDAEGAVGGGGVDAAAVVRDGPASPGPAGASLAEERGLPASRRRTRSAAHAAAKSSLPGALRSRARRAARVCATNSRRGAVQGQRLRVCPRGCGCPAASCARTPRSRSAVRWRRRAASPSARWRTGSATRASGLGRCARAAADGCVRHHAHTARVPPAAAPVCRGRPRGASTRPPQEGAGFGERVTAPLSLLQGRTPGG